MRLLKVLLMCFGLAALGALFPLAAAAQPLHFNGLLPQTDPLLPDNSLHTAIARLGHAAGGSKIYPNSAIGILKGDYNGEGAYQCSASVIDSPFGDLLLTAAHCVVNADTGVRASNLQFLPAARYGLSSYGAWQVTGSLVSPQWLASAGLGQANEAGDWAFLTVASQNGKLVKDAVGSLGIAFNTPLEQTYQEYGYPSDLPYNGNLMMTLSTGYALSDDSYSFPNPVCSFSDFTEGSSGGPWLSADGKVVSITDYSATQDGTGERYVCGSYFDDQVANAYASLRNATAIMTPVLHTNFGIVKGSGSGRQGQVTVRTFNPGRLVISNRNIRTKSVVLDQAGQITLPVLPNSRGSKRLQKSGNLKLVYQVNFYPKGSWRSSYRIGQLTLKTPVN